MVRKIGDVLSDVFGRSGQLMLEALVNGLGGEGTPSAFDIAQLARGHAMKKLDQLMAALEGHQMRTSHRTLIRHATRHMPFLAEEIEALDQDIAEAPKVLPEADRPTPASVFFGQKF